MKAFAFALVATLALSMGASAHAADVTTNPLHQALGAPENWKISGSFRTRMEAIDGQFRPAVAEDDVFLSFRATLFAEYDSGPVRVGAELFDSRGYLQKKNSSVGTTEVNALELGQAYLGFDLDDHLGDGSSSAIMVGRFTQDVGSRRLVARNQFRNTINAFTGIRFDWQDATKDEIRLFWTMPHSRLPTDSREIRHNHVEWDRESSDLQFYGGSFTKTGIFGGTVEIYGYGLHEKDAPSYPTRNRRLFTPGIRFTRASAPDRFDYDFEGIYQTGQTRATTGAADRTDLDVSAYFIHAEIGRTFAGAWSPRVVLQYDRASGDGPDPARYNRFDTLFGARRSEYGPTSLYGAIARANFSSPAVRLEVMPDKRWDGFISYRPLWLENAGDSFSGTGVRDRDRASGKFAGHQIEARARYWLVPKLARLDGGIAYLAKGRFLKAAPGAPEGSDTRYAYLDLTFTF